MGLGIQGIIPRNNYHLRRTKPTGFIRVLYFILKVRFFQNLNYSFSLRNSMCVFFKIVQRGRLLASHNMHSIRFVRSVYNSLVHCFRISYEPNWTIRIVCIYVGEETGGRKEVGLLLVLVLNLNLVMSVVVVVVVVVFK
jgi:hypothetical protein